MIFYRPIHSAKTTELPIRTLESTVAVLPFSQKTATECWHDVVGIANTLPEHLLN